MTVVDPMNDRTSNTADAAQTTRRGFVGGAAKLAGGGALALSAVATGRLAARAQDATPVPSGATPPPAIAGEDPVAAEGANAEMQAVIDAFVALDVPPINSQTPFNARNLPSFANAVQSVLAANGLPAIDVSPEVSHISIPGPAGEIVGRVYTPAGGGSGLPVIVYFHGGGFVIANLDTYDASPRALVAATGAVVVSVAYRQAPENPFPAAVDDAYAATQYLIENAAVVNGDPARVAVAGESAGGNLATVVCLRAIEEGGELPVHQLLVYPVTTFAPEGEAAESIEQNVGSPFLYPALLPWFGNYYLSDESDAADPYVSPLEAEDLSEMPPATIIAAEIDPLLSQGVAYADALEEAGVDVAYVLFEGVTHEFFGMGAVVSDANDAVAAAAARLTESFAVAG